jgi:hypothetical protein
MVVQVSEIPVYREHSEQLSSDFRISMTLEANRIAMGL